MVFKLNPIACRSNIIRFLSFSWFDFGLDLSKFDTIDFIHKIEERKKKHVSQCIRSIGECSTVVRLAQFVYWPLVYSRFTFGLFLSFSPLRCHFSYHELCNWIDLLLFQDIFFIFYSIFAECGYLECFVLFCWYITFNWVHHRGNISVPNKNRYTYWLGRDINMLISRTKLVAELISNIVCECECERVCIQHNELKGQK